MAEELAHSIEQLVHECLRIQVAWFEVCNYQIESKCASTVQLGRPGFVLTASRADDLIPEESEVVLLAIKRLPPKEAYDRVFRMRRAFQVRSPHLRPPIRFLIVA